MCPDWTDPNYTKHLSISISGTDIFNESRPSSLRFINMARLTPDTLLSSLTR